jgi:hypothetical protein
MPKHGLLILTIIGAFACTSDPVCHEEPCAEGGGHHTATGGGGSAADLPSQYCTCMLSVCHDLYHETYGPESDEPAARANCIAAAEALPEAGMDVDQGHVIECLLHHCELGVETDDNCAAAIGNGVCAE